MPLPAVNCHRHEDQSRRDDLWGWFYCLVELVEGEQLYPCGCNSVGWCTAWWRLHHAQLFACLQSPGAQRLVLLL